MVFLWFSHFPTVTTVPSPETLPGTGPLSSSHWATARSRGKRRSAGHERKMSGAARAMGEGGAGVLIYIHIYKYIYIYIYIQYILYDYYIYIYIWYIYIYIYIYGVRRVVDGWTSPSERNFLTFRSGPLSDCSSGFIFWSQGSCHRPCSRKLLMPLRRVCPELRLFCWDFWDLLYSVALGVDTLRLEEFGNGAT